MGTLGDEGGVDFLFLRLESHCPYSYEYSALKTFIRSVPSLLVLIIS